MDRTALTDRILPAPLRRRLRLALFRWRRVLRAALGVSIALLCAAALAVLIGSPPETAPSASAQISSPSPSLQAGEVLVVVTVPAQESRHLAAGETVTLVELAPRAGPPERAADQNALPRARLLWMSEPSGGGSGRSVTLGLAVEEKTAQRVAPSARSGGLAVLQSGR